MGFLGIKISTNYFVIFFSNFQMGHFKRTNSMPMIRRESMHQNNPSTSVLDLSQAQTEPGQTHEVKIFENFIDYYQKI